MTEKRRFNPLVLDEDYDKLFDEDYLDSELKDDRGPYEDVSDGARRKKPVFESDF